MIVALGKFNKDEIKSNNMINRMSIPLRTSPLLKGEPKTKTKKIL